jgi:hypothetical protein
MWIFTTIGFFSVVAHADEPRTVIIRARAREDLENLRRQHLPDLEIVENVGTDYAFRAFVNRDEWEHATAQMAAAIDYPNFKDAVVAKQGFDRAGFYVEVWETMQRLQAAASGSSSRSGPTD